MVLLLVFPTVVIMRDLGLSPAICEKPLVAASLKACAYTGFLLLLTGAAWATGGLQAAAGPPASPAGTPCRGEGPSEGRGASERRRWTRA